MRNKLLLCLLSALLLIAGWWRFGGFTLLVALVPLLMVSAGYDASWRSFWRMCGWTALTLGLGISPAVYNYWMTSPPDALWSAWAAVVVPGGVLMLYHYMSKRIRRAVANTVLVCGWVAAEYLCGVIGAGHNHPAALSLGNSFLNCLCSPGTAIHTVAPAVSLWIVACNVVVCYAVEKRSRRWTVGALAAVVLPPVAVVLAGSISGLSGVCAAGPAFGIVVTRLCTFTFALGVCYFVAYRVRRRDHLVD